MDGQATDIMIRIRKATRGGFPVEAWLNDGSVYEGKLRLAEPDFADLRALGLQPVEYGRRLFAELFSGRVGTALAVATGQAQARGDGRVRVRLWVDEEVEDRLQALKWERLVDAHGDPLATSNLTPFSRYTALSRADSTPIDTARIEMLFVASSPTNIAKSGLAEIDVEAEVGRLADALTDVWRAGRCHATILPGRSDLTPEMKDRLRADGCDVVDGPATLGNVMRLLEGKQVWHFLGHGQFVDGQGVLVLEKEDGTLERVSDTELAPRLGNTPVRIVFLAACESARREEGGPRSNFRGLAANLALKGIPAVVAMQDVIKVESAYRLTAEFYRRLFLEHGTVDRALNEARAALYEENELDWGTPALYMRLRTGQLATPNPLWIALAALEKHPDYTDFRENKYVPMPIMARVRGASDATLDGGNEAQQIGTLDLVQSVLDHLEGRPVLCRDEDSQGQPTGQTGHGTPNFILVLGGPGTSKSTQLKRIGWKTIEAAKASANAQPFLPVHVDLKEFRPTDPGSAEELQQQILRALRAFMPDETAGSLGELAVRMKQARLRVLINAGDLLHAAAQDVAEQAAMLAQDYPVHQYIVAMQPGALELNRLREVEKADPCVLVIQPLTTREIRYFLEGQEEAGQGLLNRLYDTSLFDLAGTPYFLFKMLVKARKNALPPSRASFLHQLIDAAIGQLPAEKGMRTSAAPTLRRMALEMQESGVSVWPIEELFRVMASVRGERGYAVEKLFSALVTQEVLLPVGETAARFAYHSIQSYFSAKALLALPDRERRLSRITDSLGSPLRSRWWEETLVITCGLLAADGKEAAMLTLQRLLEPIVYGSDLMEGETVFLAARCLLECQPVRETKGLQALIQHVVSALEWRANSAFEHELARRLQSTQLLAQLAMPEIAVCLARNTYDRVRQNVGRESDYEFSSVRFAGAIALKRMSAADADLMLKAINLKLASLFHAWQGKCVEDVIRESKKADDPGLQGLAALALGDLHGALSNKNPDSAKLALDRLVAMFRSEKTPQSVRWAVADALALLDITQVSQSLTEPLLAELADPLQRKQLKEVAKLRKTLAYLLGLLHHRNYQVRKFLAQDCLGQEGSKGSRDWSTWATAIVALGRIASKEYRALIAGIAAGRVNGAPLAELFTEPGQRTYVRKEAINTLAILGDFGELTEDDVKQIAADPDLARTYYRAKHDVYWRQGGMARFEY